MLSVGAANCLQAVFDIAGERTFQLSDELSQLQQRLGVGSVDQDSDSQAAFRTLSRPPEDEKFFLVDIDGGDSFGVSDLKRAELRQGDFHFSPRQPILSDRLAQSKH